MLVCVVGFNWEPSSVLKLYIPIVSLFYCSVMSIIYQENDDTALSMIMYSLLI